MKPLITAAVLLLISMVSTAQSSWTAWLYAASDGSITRVNANGEIIDVYRLPLSQAFNTYGDAAVASGSGRFVAYTAYDSTAPQLNRQLFVYDAGTGIIRFTYDLSDVTAIDFEQMARPTAFDEGAQTFAFGVLRGGQWELVLADLTTEQVKGGGPLTEALAGLPAGLPVVLHVQGDRVSFVIHTPGMALDSTYDLYVWRPAQAPQVVGMSALVADVRGFGELVTPALEADTPSMMTADSAMTTLAAKQDPYNAIDIYSPASGSATRLSNLSGHISQVWWVAGGRQVLAAGSDDGGAPIFSVYGLDGSQVGQFSLVLEDVRGTPDGVAGLFDRDGALGLAHIETQNGTLAARTVYTTTDRSVRLLLVAQ
jgi:hypothetical protein